MKLATISSRANVGIDALSVSIEIHLSNGLPRLNIVGLAETAVKESKDRVRSALLTSQFEFPPRRITVNLAPADLPKEGGRFDLPIAIGILAASGQIPSEALLEYEFIGELALSGELRAVTGVLAVAIAAKQAKHKLVVPRANAQEAALVGFDEIYAIDHISDICAHLTGIKPLKPFFDVVIEQRDDEADFVDIIGQQGAKRALEIAAAGQHSLLMCGPPGTGKTMLASRLPSILPVMAHEDALQVAALQSISQKPIDYQRWRRRPFRAPHHTASGVALVGGGRPPRPGEISLAHHGVLFLDELPEFSRHVLETLREPLESGVIAISRAGFQAQFPARFQLIAAMNPCPCGYLGDARQRCQCSAEQVARYRSKISGPLLDRIDMLLGVTSIPEAQLLAPQIGNSETSAVVRERVMAAQQSQLARAGKLNSALSNRELSLHCYLDGELQAYFVKAITALHLSARAIHRVLRVARTIADLSQSIEVKKSHLQEALSYRMNV